MMTVKEVREWLLSLSDDTEIGISDGGMHITTEFGKDWLEIGALPKDSDGANL